MFLSWELCLLLKGACSIDNPQKFYSNFVLLLFGFSRHYAFWWQSYIGPGWKLWIVKEGFPYPTPSFVKVDYCILVLVSAIFLPVTYFTEHSYSGVMAVYCEAFGLIFCHSEVFYFTFIYTWIKTINLKPLKICILPPSNYSFYMSFLL